MPTRGLSPLPIFHDIGARFLDAEGRLNAAHFWDRLHPNPSGYDIWAEEIERTELRVSN